MRTTTLPLALLLCLWPSAARAQIRFGISIGLPVAPQMELVGPGIQVVTGFQEEVFLQGGWYWCRRPDGWYRSRRGQSRFEYVESRRVPRGLVAMPEGRYRNWHGENHGIGHDREGRERDHGRPDGEGRHGHDKHDRH